MKYEKPTYAQEMAMIDVFHAFVDSYMDDNDSCVNVRSAYEAGVLFVDDNGAPYRGEISAKLYHYIMNEYGQTNRKWSESFHKSWNKVHDSSIEELVFAQLIHYMSTYGMEDLGYKAIPLLPMEDVVSDPDAMPGFNGFTIIRMVSYVQMLAMCNELFEKLTAPNKMWMEEYDELLKFAQVVPSNIKSFELKIMRYEQLGVAPEDPQDFLRYVVYSLTGSTLLIKDKMMFNTLKMYMRHHGNGERIAALFAKADLVKLSTIFNRYKPIFLALKCDATSSYINKIGHLSKTHHIPMSDVNVQNFTKLAKEKRYADALQVVEHCSSRQLLKLWNFVCTEGLRYLEAPELPSIYNIRNGRMFIDSNRHGSYIKQEYFDMIRDEICSRYEYQFSDKIFFIPKHIMYSVPVTEKQFIGNIPWGSYIATPTDAFTAAIYWENYKGQRTDIDLHLTGIGRSYGWNSGYRDGDDVIYSGDMTDATHGAVEAYHFRNDNEKMILSASNFTGMDNVPYQVFFTKDTFEPSTDWDDAPKTPVVDVKNALFPAIPVAFKGTNTQTIGLFANEKFYFYGGEMGMGRVPNRDLYASAIDTLAYTLENSLKLYQLLMVGGAVVVDEDGYKELSDEQKAQVIDLSPASLTQRTILDLVDIAD